MKHKSISDSWMIILLGFTTIITQVVIMRELVIIFYGNELSLGSILGIWLLFTGIGSSVLPQILKKHSPPRLRIGLIQVSFVFILPLMLLLARSGRTLLQTTPGEMIGFIPSLGIIIIVLAPFCLLSGLLYTTACKLIHQSDLNNPGIFSKVYFLEAIGAGIGGMLTSFILIHFATPTQTFLLIIVLNLTVAFGVGNINPFKKKILRRGWVLLIPLIIGIGGIAVSGNFQMFCNRTLWKGFHLILSRNTALGNIAITRIGDQFSFFENGILIFNSIDLQAAEESIHFALLEHPHPKKVLLIGGGLGGGLTEILRHPSVEDVDYVELDPAIFQLARSILPSERLTSLEDPRVRYHNMDGRLFLKTSAIRFDAILLVLPTPYTAQINRFYTVEFFREVLKNLNSSGIFSIQVSSSENAISPELSDFLSTISGTLTHVFPDVVIFPGETTHFICSNNPGRLTSSPDELIQRLKDRNLNTLYVSEYSLPYQMSDDRRNFVKEHLYPVQTSRLNWDFKPIGYFYNTILWATYFTTLFKKIFIGFSKLNLVWLFGFLTFLTSMVLVVTRPFKDRSRLFSTGILFSIFGVGFTEISLEVILILGFQILYGFAYRQMALIIAGYMAGLALGSRLALSPRLTNDKLWTRFRLSQTMMFVYPLIVTVIFLKLKNMESVSLHSVWIGSLFVVLAATSGLIGGFQFPLANRLYIRKEFRVEKAAGFLYSFDLFGSSLGALVTSALLIPVLGIFQTLILLSFINLCGLCLVLFGREIPEVI